MLAAAAIDNLLNSTMMARASLVAGCLLASTASATVSPADSFPVRAEDVLSRPYVSVLSAEAAAFSSPSPPRAVLRRQTNANRNTTSDGQGLQLRPDGALDLSAWDTVTDAICVEALRGIQRSSNPSGNCICYNLPSLDTTSGVFEAELRLYKISEPRAPWVGIGPAEIKVSVTYNGASASPVSPANTPKRRGGGSDTFEDDGPQLLQAYMLVGQIDRARMSDLMSMAAIQSLIMPTLTLSATNASGSHVATNVSLNEATFLNGVFSREVVLSDFSAAQAAVDDALAALRNGSAAFVLPGVNIMMFPIGLVITSIWLFLGLAAYGLGTFDRIQYAEMFKQRKAFDSSRSRAGSII